uniref:Uncharacterized protein n=1 Tax=Halalkalibacterium halodurans TaxID=86665 RepID=A0A0M0KIM0_ALKHA
MKTTFIILILIYFLTILNIFFSKNGTDLSNRITHYAPSNVVEIDSFSFSTTYKHTKNFSLSFQSPNLIITFYNDLVKSFVPTLKINSYLITIKYGSTLILLA